MIKKILKLKKVKFVHNLCPKLQFFANLNAKDDITKISVMSLFLDQKSVLRHTCACKQNIFDWRKLNLTFLR